MRRNAGFSLVELLVALAIGGMVVVMAHRAFGAATDLTLALDARRSRHDERMEARRWLATVLGSADPSSPGSTGFHGTPERLAFTTRVRGLLQPLEVVVSHGWLVALTSTDTTRLVRTDGITAAYLLDLGADERWVQEWQSPASAPVAVRLCIARADSTGRVDTLLLAIGFRG